jgi:hypothetical protein
LVFIFLSNLECLCLYYLISPVHDQKKVFNHFGFFAGRWKNALIEIEYWTHGNKNIVRLLGSTEITSDQINSVFIPDFGLQPDSLLRHEIAYRLMYNLGGNLDLPLSKSRRHVHGCDKKNNGREAQEAGKRKGPTCSHPGLRSGSKGAIRCMVEPETPIPPKHAFVKDSEW